MVGPRMKPKQHYTITEAARFSGVTRASMFDAIKTGRVKATRGEILRKTEGWLIDPKTLEQYEVSLSHQERGKKN